ncbi:MAG TPA: DUF1836 domain-containing protein [Clostridiales bacterium]|nr:DUF1836 domain-containing protein [Clostridiales bacterium]
MEQLKSLIKQFLDERPVPWNGFPDIDLYMDQLINYMPRQQIISRNEDRLTPAMVNNYIKAGLLERAKGKRYSREHLAELTMICLLKQIISVKDAALLFSKFGDRDVQSNYEYYLEDLDKALTRVATELDTELDESEIPRAIMRLAVESYAYKLACLRLIDILRENEDKSKKR